MPRQVIVKIPDGEDCELCLFRSITISGVLNQSYHGYCKYYKKDLRITVEWVDDGDNGQDEIVIAWKCKDCLSGISVNG